MSRAPVVESHCPRGDDDLLHGRRQWCPAASASLCGVQLAATWLWSLLLLVSAGCAAREVPELALVTGTTYGALGNVPDPFVFVEGHIAYVYATNGRGHNVQLLKAEVDANADADAGRFAWVALPDAMPRLASWVLGGFTWAPEVVRSGAKMLLYYTARDRRTNRQCIGVAVGAGPEGPFDDPRDEPLLCQEPDGSIDASPFVADGRVVLYVKSDGNCCGRPTTLYAQALSADGLALSGSPVSLLQNDPTGWEGGVIEAPSMLVHDDRHFLFYSGGAFASAAYGVGVATCEGAFGPCRRLPTAQPLLASRHDAVSPLFGPGHQALFRMGSKTWMAYHAWEVDTEGRRGTRRVLHIDRVEWKKDAGPTPWRPPVSP